MKRQRGRGRKPGGGGGGGGHQGNRPFESNGPDVKIRGTAAQIYEKYAQYARDAQSAGDRVKTENYLQHAEHYFRIMAATMPREQRVAQQNGEGGMPGPMGINTPGEERDNEEVSADPMKVVDEQVDDEGDDAEGDDVEGGDDGEEAQASGGGQDERGEGQGDRQGRRRRRGRRRHHEGQGGGDQGGGGENRSEGRGDGEARSALDSLARKQGALAGG